MKNSQVELVCMDAVGTLTAAFTAATTDIITSNAHGLKNGDKVVLTTTDTLPAGLALATVYYVIEAATNTFKLSVTPIRNYTTGQADANWDDFKVDITDTGTGTHTFTMHDIGNAIYCNGFRNIIIGLNTESNANLTIKFQTSTQEEMPDFSAAQSPTNRWDYCDTIDEEDKSSVDGDTGYSLAGTDDNRRFMVNSDGFIWLNAIRTAWSAGNATVKVYMVEN